jgi:hypothetical protein
MVAATVGIWLMRSRLLEIRTLITFFRQNPEIRRFDWTLFFRKFGIVRRLAGGLFFTIQKQPMSIPD